ncbi:hypothetical protein GGQ64_004741 [Rhizobium azooxidifex]|uniref:Uncharacterized protein n=1 Tax=Mycoplana azooxidifex TaxID=1636188 RepID=A0A7W6DI84_9HYPH|nr:hypothetical protein [Mycoplana azooxidifex]
MNEDCAALATGADRTMGATGGGENYADCWGL